MRHIPQATLRSATKANTDTRDLFIQGIF